MIFYSALIEIMHLVPFSSCNQLFVENCQFLRTQLRLVLPLGVTPFEFWWDLWRQKTTVSGLLYGIVFI